MREMKDRQQVLTYKQKLEQANREALATLGALAVTVLVWVACGFGLAGLDIQVFHTPLWVVGGTLGTWACAIVVSIVLAKRFFADFELDDEDGSMDHEGAIGPASPTSVQVNGKDGEPRG